MAESADSPGKQRVRLGPEPVLGRCFSTLTEEKGQPCAGSGGWWDLCRRREQVRQARGARGHVPFLFRENASPQIIRLAHIWKHGKARHLALSRQNGLFARKS